jgi:aspartokinase-like uncharacterized kinase
VPTTWVVKLGGSFADSERLPLWLEALAESGAVIVPGGGPFAGQVRAAQSRWRFGDEAAHAMAILAMAQYGRMLSGMCPKLLAASDFEGLNGIVETGGTAVWLPDVSRLPEAEIPASWDVTSDSLAAWLAGRIGARRLLLVKSAEIPEGRAPVEQCAAEGWVDSAFPRFAAGAGCEVWLCGPGHPHRLCEGLSHPESSFTRVM